MCTQETHHIYANNFLAQKDVLEILINHKGLLEHPKQGKIPRKQFYRDYFVYLKFH